MTAVRETAPEFRADIPQKEIRFGSKEDLLQGRPLRTKDVEVVGKTYRVRELRQSEVEEISRSVMHAESDTEGKVTSTMDMRGYKARTVAFALVHLDLSPLFKDPATEYKDLNQLTPDVMEALFEAVDSLSALTKKARDDLGKGSAKATS